MSHGTLMHRAIHPVYDTSDTLKSCSQQRFNYVFQPVCEASSSKQALLGRDALPVQRSFEATSEKPARHSVYMLYLWANIIMAHTTTTNQTVQCMLYSNLLLCVLSLLRPITASFGYLQKFSDQVSYKGSSSKRKHYVHLL